MLVHVFHREYSTRPSGIRLLRPSNRVLQADLADVGAVAFHDEQVGHQVPRQ